MISSDNLKVFLHIGSEKTGTTSIQRSLLVNSEALLERGIATLSATASFEANSIELPLAIREDLGFDLVKFRKLPFKEFQNSVAKKIQESINLCRANKYKSIVCSSEHLSSRLTEIEDLRILKSFFDEFCEFKIIVYLRRQDELLLGAQAEGIKYANSNSTEFSDPRLLQDRRPYGIVYYDYERLLEPWAIIFGIKNIIVKPYEAEQLLGGDVVDDFFSIVDENFTPKHLNQEDINLNRRLSPEVLHFLVFVSPYISEKTRRLLIDTLPFVDKFEQGTLIENEQLYNFREYFKKSNEIVARKYINRDYLFKKKSFARLREYKPNLKKSDVTVNFKIFGDILEILINK